MNKKLEYLVVFIGAFFMFSIGMILLEAGRIAYGPDVSIIWASGILTLIGINGIVNSLLNAYNDYKVGN